MIALPGPLALLLDFDGTLVPIMPTPDAVRVTNDLRALIAEAAERLEGRIAIISGRSLDQLDALWGTALTSITVAASHGLELRTDRAFRSPDRSDLFARLAQEAERHFGPGSGVILETKSFGLGVHYRLAPTVLGAVETWVAAAAVRHALVVQEGDMVRELRPAGADKGDAVRAIMQLGSFAGSRPVYFGDDLTDIPALAAAQACGGRGIAVGPRIAAHADETVENVSAVRHRIRALLG
jgi:trehalose 6-phosphate phosphatase